MSQDPDPNLLAAAEEELAQACALTYEAMAKIAPWGDSYDGFAPGGQAVTFERNYLWSNEKGGDIMVEVVAFAGESQRDAAAEVGRVIRKP